MPSVKGFGYFYLGESVSLTRIAGIGLICFGIVVVSQSTLNSYAARHYGGSGFSGAALTYQLLERGTGLSISI
jgi:drug/metabolite transporter (DMT)-like permease